MSAVSDKLQLEAVDIGPARRRSLATCLSQQPGPAVSPHARHNLLLIWKCVECMVAGSFKEVRPGETQHDLRLSLGEDLLLDMLCPLSLDRLIH